MPSLPRPPIKNMTDFVVFAFVAIVSFVLISASVTLVINAVMRPDEDQSQGVAIMADVTTSLISALVGFLAGKGQGRSEAEERQQEQELRKMEIEHGISPSAAPVAPVEDIENKESA